MLISSRQNGDPHFEADAVDPGEDVADGVDIVNRPDAGIKLQLKGDVTLAGVAAVESVVTRRLPDAAEPLPTVPLQSADAQRTRLSHTTSPDISIPTSSSVTYDIY